MPRAPKSRLPRRPPVLLLGLLALLLSGIWAGLGTGHLSWLAAIALAPDARPHAGTPEAATLPEAPRTEPRGSVSPGSVSPGSVSPSWMPTLDRPMTLLVMGTDAVGSKGRASLDGNTDTMLLFRLDPRENQIRVVSIPRDTRTYIPGHTTFKINAANAWGGPELAARTVSGLLGVPVDRYFLVSLQGVITAIDAIGGVEVEVPKRLVYRDRAGGLAINLKPGRQRLDGKAVEGLLRFRHDDLGDVGRVQRQQGFLLELAPQMLQPGRLLKLPAVMGILRNNAETNLSPYEMLQIAGWLRTLGPAPDLQLTVLPGRPAMIGGGWFWLAEPQRIDAFLVAHYGKRPSERLATEAPSITVMRPAGLTQEAWSEVLADLQAAGYRVNEEGPRPMEAETRVISQRGDPEGAERLVRTLGSGRVLVAGLGDMRTDYTLHLGTDWLAARYPAPHPL